MVSAKLPPTLPVSKFRLYRWVLVWIIVFLLPIVAFAKFDPDLNWRTVETKNFRIHYSQGQKEIAVRMAGIAERVHRRLSAYLRWTPEFRKTAVVLRDDTDRANGSATPFPNNTINMFLSSPPADSIVANTDNWLEALFIHEYTHILHLDMSYGLPYYARFITGRSPLCGCIGFGNVFNPVFITEGYATYIESNYGEQKNKWGRGNFTLADMVVRGEFMGDKAPSIADAGTFPSRWPAGNYPYLFGERFIRYLEQEKKADGFRDYIHDYSANYWPFLMGNSSGRVYQKSLGILWQNWVLYERRKYATLYSKLKKQGFTEPELLTSSGYVRRGLRFYGDTLYFYENNGKDEPALRVYRPGDKTKSQPLTPVLDPAAIAPADGVLYFTDVDIADNYNQYRDIFRYDGSVKRLTQSARVESLDVNVKAKTFIAVRQIANGSKLYIGQPKDLAAPNRWQEVGQAGMRYSNVRLNTDGSLAVYSGRGPNDFLDLYLFDVKTKTHRRLTQDIHNELHPVFHPKKNTILFSCDRNGIYNICEIDPQGGGVKGYVRLTNVFGGLFSPEFNQTGSMLYLTSYGRTGYNLARIPVPELKPYEDYPVLTQTLPSSQAKGAVAYTDENYSLLPNLWPSIWTPVFESGEISGSNFGILVASADALFLHSYSLQVVRSEINNQLNVGASYTYTGSTLDHSFFYVAELQLDENKAGPSGRLPNGDYINNRTHGAAYDAAYSFNSKWFNQAVGLTVAYFQIDQDSFETRSSSFKRINSREFHEVQAGPRYSFANVDVKPYSVSFEDGFIFSAGALGGALILNDRVSESLRGNTALSLFIPGLGDNQILYWRTGFDIITANDYDVAGFVVGRYASDELQPENESGVRGYPFFLGPLGTKRLAMSFEYRFRLAHIDWGPSLFGIFLRNLNIRPFFDIGQVFDNEFAPAQLKKGAGLELNIVQAIAYQANIRFGLGVAHGFDTGGETQVYFIVGGRF